MEPSIATWGREHYPRLMGNEKLIEALYRRQVLNRPTLIAQTMAYPLTQLHDIQIDKPVSVVVTKVEVSVVEYSVCKVCNRSAKNCNDKTHGNEKIPLYVVNLLAGDESGMEKFQSIGTDKTRVDALQAGETFVMTGSMTLHEKFGKEFEIKSFAALTDQQLDAWSKLEDYYAIHGGEGGISEDEFEKAVGSNGELLAPVFERVYINRQEGRVRF